MDDVLLLAEDGSVIGTMPKRDVHTRDTPLHLAFSCYVRDSAGRILVTRRALTKQTWPGVWTNSFCGHPRPGEDPMASIHRRASEELGITITNLILVLPDYRYRAVDATGIVENEICPVYTAVASTDPMPSPHEVSEWHWTDPAALASAVGLAPYAFSPWLGEQLPLLVENGAI